MHDIISDADIRRQKDFRRLRTQTPVCLSCGYSGSSSALELAHIAPRQFHDDGGVLCSNCHREMSDAEKDLSYAPQSENPQLETIGRYLIALSEWFKRIAETIAAFGRWLLDFAESSDAIEPEAIQ